MGCCVSTPETTVQHFNETNSSHSLHDNGNVSGGNSGVGAEAGGSRLKEDQQTIDAVLRAARKAQNPVAKLNSLEADGSAAEASHSNGPVTPMHNETAQLNTSLPRFLPFVPKRPSCALNTSNIDGTTSGVPDSTARETGTGAATGGGGVGTQEKTILIVPGNNNIAAATISVSTLLDEERAELQRALTNQQQQQCQQNQTSNSTLKRNSDSTHLQQSSYMMPGAMTMASCEGLASSVVRYHADDASFAV